MDRALDFNELEETGIGKKFQDVLCTMLDSSYLFKDFNRQEIEQHVHYMHGYKAPKGAVLFQEGGRDSHLIIITVGKAKVLKDDGMGSNKQVDSLSTTLNKTQSFNNI